MPPRAFVVTTLAPGPRGEDSTKRSPGSAEFTVRPWRVPKHSRLLDGRIIQVHIPPQAGSCVTSISPFRQMRTRPAVGSQSRGPIIAQYSVLPAPSHSRERMTKESPGRSLLYGRLGSQRRGSMDFSSEKLMPFRFPRSEAGRAPPKRSQALRS